MNGFELWARTTPLITFDAFDVRVDDLVVLHLNSEACDPAARNERNSPAQYAGSHGYAAAFDWYSSAPGLVNTDNVLTLYDSAGRIVDAALFSDDPLGTAAAASEQQARRSRLRASGRAAAELSEQGFRG